ncbi:hypothetical protein ACJX0J_023749 [Zea mays]
MATVDQGEELDTANFTIEEVKKALDGKAYDKQAMRMKGFSPSWCAWIQKIVSGGHVGVKRLSTWKTKFLSSGGRSLPIFMIFFWQGGALGGMFKWLYKLLNEDGMR